MYKQAFLEGFIEKLARNSAEIKIRKAAKDFNWKKTKIDRPKGYKHKGGFVYPTDYGYMTNLDAVGDGEGYDFFVLPGEKLGPKSRVLGGFYTKEGEPKLIVGKERDDNKIKDIIQFSEYMHLKFGKKHKPRFVSV